MATRLFFHQVSYSGTYYGIGWRFPTSEQSSGVASTTWANANTLLQMRDQPDSVGSHTAITQATQGQSTPQLHFIRMFASRPIAVSGYYGGAGKTVYLNTACLESNAAANFWADGLHVYTWRPSTNTKVGTFVDNYNTNLGTEPNATNVYKVILVSGVATSTVPIERGDILVCEVWANFSQGNTTSRTAGFAYDGAVQNEVANTTVTDHASFINFTDDFTFYDGIAIFDGAGEIRSSATTFKIRAGVARLDSSSKLAANGKVIRRANARLDSQSEIDSHIHLANEGHAQLDSILEISANSKVIRKAVLKLDSTSELKTINNIVKVGHIQLYSSSELKTNSQIIRGANVHLDLHSEINSNIHSANNGYIQLNSKSKLLLNAHLNMRSIDTIPRYEFIQQIFADDIDNNEFFGSRLISSESGNILFVANLNPNPHTVYIYENAGSGSWSQKQKLLYPYLQDHGFGEALATTSDGSLLFVGAYHSDVNIFAGGEVHIFENAGSGSWSEKQSIFPSDNRYDANFGYAIDCTDDGQILFVSANNHLARSGLVYIFANYGSGSWSQIQTLTGSGYFTGDSYGHDIVCNSDGSLLFVGAPYSDFDGYQAAGLVYVYENAGSGSWSQKCVIKSNDITNNNFFGENIGLNSNGSELFIGDIISTSVEYFQNYGSGSWSYISQIEKFAGGFGENIKYARDTGQLVISAHTEDLSQDFPDIQNGSVYFYENSNNNWIQKQQVISPNRQTFGSFGININITRDGLITFIGADSEDTSPYTNNGTVYILQSKRPFITTKFEDSSNIILNSNRTIGASIKFESSSEIKINTNIAKSAKTSLSSEANIYTYGDAFAVPVPQIRRGAAKLYNQLESSFYHKLSGSFKSKSDINIDITVFGKISTKNISTFNLYSSSKFKEGIILPGKSSIDLKSLIGVQGLKTIRQRAILDSKILVSSRNSIKLASRLTSQVELELKSIGQRIISNFSVLFNSGEIKSRQIFTRRSTSSLNSMSYLNNKTKMQILSKSVLDIYSDIFANAAEILNRIKYNLDSSLSVYSRVFTKNTSRFDVISDLKLDSKKIILFKADFNNQSEIDFRPNILFGGFHKFDSFIDINNRYQIVITNRVKFDIESYINYIYRRFINSDVIFINESDLWLVSKKLINSNIIFDSELISSYFTRMSINTYASLLSNSEIKLQYIAEPISIYYRLFEVNLGFNRQITAVLQK